MDKKYRTLKKVFALVLVSALTAALLCICASAEMGMSNAIGRNHSIIGGGAKSNILNDMPNDGGSGMKGNLGDTDGDGVIEDDGEGGNSLIPEGGAVGDAVDDITGAIDDMMPGTKDTARDTARDTSKDNAADSGMTDSTDNGGASRTVGAIVAIVVAVALIIAVIVLIPKMRNRD